MDGWTRPTWVPLSLFLSRSRSSSSITQPRHEYKWRPVKSRDRVPVNGFLLGLRQQCSSNGFSLTGFNHVPWYPLKRMQIVNQTSSPPFCCCLRLVPCDHLAIIHLALTSHFLFLQPSHISPTSLLPCSVRLDLPWRYWHEPHPGRME